MKSMIKSVAVLGIGVLSLVAVGSASAGPGPRGGFRGGFGGGFRGGFGGPRVSLGFGFGGYGYRPFYGGYYGYGYPAIGFRLGGLPYGYWPFYYDDVLYYGYNGVYYQQSEDNGYQVVAAPVGAEVPKRPAKAKSIIINDEQYYVLNGVYYKELIKDDGTKAYLIAGKDGVLNTDQNSNMPQVGDVVDQLPDNCRDVTIGKKIYHVSPDDVYYEEQYDGNTTTYKVVGVPTNQGGGKQVQPRKTNSQPAPSDQPVQEGSQSGK